MRIAGFDFVRLVIAITGIEQHIRTCVFAGNGLCSHQGVIDELSFATAGQGDGLWPCPLIITDSDVSEIENVDSGNLVVGIISIFNGSATGVVKVFFIPLALVFILNPFAASY